jgi:hypothetical protein
MQHRRLVGLRAAAVVLSGVALLAAAPHAVAQQPKVVTPQPTVPEVFTLMGQYVRVAYNNEGYVTMGYKMAQLSVGEEWMLLEAGFTMREPAKDYKLKRTDISVKTPDGTIVPLASQKEYAEAGYLPALNNRARVARDSINYFPVAASRGCPVQFYAQPGRGIAWDEVELSSNRGCVGRLYFKIPGGIKVGQYWLIVKFSQSEVQVPFRILTKEEEKQLEKSWEDLKKAHEESYKQ